MENFFLSDGPLSVRIDSIDLQHANLYNQMTVIGRLIRAGQDIHKVGEELEDFHQAMASHFDHEESFFNAMSFGRIRAHKKAHRDFLRKLAAFNRTVTKREKKSVFDGFVLMEESFFKHIVEFDLDLRFTRFTPGWYTVPTASGSSKAHWIEKQGGAEKAISLCGLVFEETEVLATAEAADHCIRCKREKSG